jgi:hypothetical protein
VLIADKSQQDRTLSPDNKWIAEFRRFETEQQLSPEMVAALVARIEVYDGARIEVTLRYRDEFESLMACLDEYTEETRD